ncbi:hypothetical protein BKA69DRAFT_900148 [Paraphysoderma sedebokerense]|nr:hypothetical protein BKA69DRAFT_900148 [Paraphysoderma sedebokerense]
MNIEKSVRWLLDGIDEDDASEAKPKSKQSKSGKPRSLPTVNRPFSSTESTESSKQTPSILNTSISSLIVPSASSQKPPTSSISALLNQPLNLNSSPSNKPLSLLSTPLSSLPSTALSDSKPRNTSSLSSLLSGKPSASTSSLLRQPLNLNSTSSLQTSSSLSSSLSNAKSSTESSTTLSSLLKSAPGATLSSLASSQRRASSDVISAALSAIGSSAAPTTKAATISLSSLSSAAPQQRKPPTSSFQTTSSATSIQKSAPVTTPSIPKNPLSALPSQLASLLCDIPSTANSFSNEERDLYRKAVNNVFGPFFRYPYSLNTVQPTKKNAKDIKPFEFDTPSPDDVVLTAQSKKSGPEKRIY